MRELKEEDFKGTLEKFLSEYNDKVGRDFKQRIQRFEEFTGKSIETLLFEAIQNRDDPIHKDDVASLLFKFGKALLSGEISQKGRGSQKGGKPLQGKILEGKGYAEKSVATYLGSIRAFFTRYDVNLKLKELKRKESRLRNPRTLTKKYLFRQKDLGDLFNIANVRDKAIMTLGLMGQDESTVVSFKIEDFNEKLEGDKVSLIEFTRPKGNVAGVLMLTPEAQEILKSYIVSLGKSQGWLFEGYGRDHLNPAECNTILKGLVKAVKIQTNGERGTFHCLRAWFSTKLKNVGVDADIVNLLQGHQVEYDGSYLLKVETAVSQPRVIEALTIVPKVGKQDLEKTQSTIQGLVEEMERMRRVIEEQANEIQNFNARLDLEQGYGKELTSKEAEEVKS